MRRSGRVDTAHHLIVQKTASKLRVQVFFGQRLASIDSEVGATILCRQGRAAAVLFANLT